MRVGLLMLGVVGLGACDPLGPGPVVVTDDTGACSADTAVQYAYELLNVPDYGYQDEQLTTEFGCEACGSDFCLDAPTACVLPESDFPYDDTEDTAVAPLAGEADPELAVGATQVLTAKLALIEVKRGSRAADDVCADPTYLQEVIDTYSVQTGERSPLPPPPTGNCPGVTADPSQCLRDYDPGQYPTSPFLLSMESGTPEKLLNETQYALHPTVYGCWIRATVAEGADPNLVWFAALYGMVNFGTGAVVQFTEPCSSSQQTLTAFQMKISMDDPAAMMLWLDNPRGPTAPVPTGKTIQVYALEFAQGTAMYRWEGGWQGETPPWWDKTRCSGNPFKVGAGTPPFPPFAIIDPADAEEMYNLHKAAVDLSTMTFDFNEG